jgi:hypothetical protein
MEVKLKQIKIVKVITLIILLLMITITFLMLLWWSKRSDQEVRSELVQLKKLVEIEKLKTGDYAMALDNLFGESGKHKDTIDKYKSLKDSFCLEQSINNNKYCIDLANSENLGSCEDSGLCNFEDVKTQYSLTIDIDGKGTILPGRGEHIYYKGQTVTISATPDPGYEFVKWIGACNGTNSCSVTMDEEKTVKAIFLTIGDSYGEGKVASIEDDYILIAASIDNSDGYQWGCYGQSVFSGTSQRNGQINTTKIVNFHDGWASPWNTLDDAGTGDCSLSNNGEVAAKLCSNYRSGEHSDWYLPSIKELEVLYANRSLIGEFVNSHYWSSTEESGYNAWLLNFKNGDQYYYFKPYFYHVRCVRRH